MTVTQFVKLQMCLGSHYIESYRKGIVDVLYQKSEIYNKKNPYRGGIICLKLTIC